MYEEETSDWIYTDIGLVCKLSWGLYRPLANPSIEIYSATWKCLWRSKSSDQIKLVLFWQDRNDCKPKTLPLIIPATFPREPLKSECTNRWYSTYGNFISPPKYSYLHIDVVKKRSDRNTGMLFSGNEWFYLNFRKWIVLIIHNMNDTYFPI